MSRIVSPNPPSLLAADRLRSASVCWWRLRLNPDAEDRLMLMNSDAKADDGSGATWYSWEFFDGHDTVIDTGFDRPTEVRITQLATSAWIDVLSEDRPTPTTSWQRLTIPGGWLHPDDDAETVVG